MCTRQTLTVIFAVVSLASLAARTVRGSETPQGNPSVTHAFAVSKQRFTLGMPEGSRKTLVDLWEPGLVLRWTTRSLLDVDALKAGVGQPNEQLRIVPRIPPHWQARITASGTCPSWRWNTKGPGASCSWKRSEGPTRISSRSCSGQQTGNRSASALFCKVRMLHATRTSYCYVKTRVCLRGCRECACQHSNAGMEITVSAGKDPRTVWIAIPHRAEVKDIAAYRARNWAEAWGRAVEAWRQVLARAVRFSIPDAKVADAYYSCLADQFILREPIRAAWAFFAGPRYIVS